MKLFGQRLMARDFERQVAKLPVRVAVLNGSTALGIPFTKVEGRACPRLQEVLQSANLCNRAEKRVQKCR